MKQVSLPLWVYAGGLWAIATAGLTGYLNATQIRQTPTPINQPEQQASLPQHLTENDFEHTTSGNITLISTDDVNAVLEMIQKKRILITNCQITAEDDYYRIRLESAQ